MAILSDEQLTAMGDEELLEVLHTVRAEFDRRASGDLLSIIREQLAEASELEPGDVPVKVVFHTMEFDNGWFYLEYSAKVYLRGENEPVWFDFEGERISGLMAALSDHAGPDSLLTVDLVTGSVDDND